MAAFSYKAIDKKGKQKSGVLEADSAKLVRQQLRDKGLVPLEVATAANKEKQTHQSGFTLFKRKISASELALMTRQLATLVESALPVEEALLAVAEQCDKPRLKNMIMAVRSKVVEGYTLADSMADFPHIFDRLYRAMVAAGEKSGHLNVVLNRLADYTERRQETKSQLSQALVYPVILVLFSIAIVYFLMTSVVPQVIGQFVQSGDPLPPSTQLLINVSDFFQAYGLTVALVVASALLIFKQLLKKDGFRMKYHKLLLSVPLVGKVVIGQNTARYSRTLSILSASAVPLLEGMRIAGDVLTNDYIQKSMSEAANMVREGTSLKASLEQSKIFPPMMLHMIASGEKSGELQDMLGRAADNQDREFNALLSISMSVFQPVLVVSMALLVLFIVMAMLQPILEMNKAVGL